MEQTQHLNLITMALLNEDNACSGNVLSEQSKLSSSDPGDSVGQRPGIPSQSLEFPLAELHQGAAGESNLPLDPCITTRGCIEGLHDTRLIHRCPGHNSSIPLDNKAVRLWVGNKLRTRMPIH